MYCFRTKRIMALLSNRLQYGEVEEHRRVLLVIHRTMRSPPNW